MKKKESISNFDRIKPHFWESVGQYDHDPSACLNNKHQLPQSYIPIEVFKYKNLTEGFDDLKKFFLSSGTTSENRSRSPFSTEGLKSYQDSSLRNFKQCLSEIFPAPDLSIGVSLIPNADSAPDSSLSQMLTWISEKFKTYFVTLENFSTIVTELSSKGHKNVWIFATGFHLIQYSEDFDPIPIPEEWKIFETGGTKGKVREVTAGEYQNLLTNFFSIDESQIISEYGMCELSAQAYRLGFNNRYSFPPWVHVLVETAPDNFESQGVGALAVFDYARLDVPLFIRTQDLVCLRDNGEFELLGRIQGSPLKGCSMNFEHSRLIASTRLIRNENKSPPLPQKDFNHEALSRELLAQDQFRHLLRQELGHDKVFSWSLSELKESMDCFDLNKIYSLYRKSAKKWSFIAPSTHSFAIIYPLWTAAALGIEVDLKLSSKNPNVHRTLVWFSDYLTKKASAKINIINDISSLDPENPLFFQGNSNTLDLISLRFKHIKAFTEANGVSVIDIEEGPSIESVAKDILHLNQQGCMSSKCLLFIDNGNTEDILSFVFDLNTYLDELVEPIIDKSHLLACFHQKISDSLSEGSCIERIAPNNKFYIHQIMDLEKLKIASTSFTISAAIIQPEQLPYAIQRLQVNAGYLNISSNSNLIKSGKNITVKPTGEIGINKWNGLHQGEKLFSLQGQELNNESCRK